MCLIDPHNMLHKLNFHDFFHLLLVVIYYIGLARDYDRFVCIHGDLAVLKDIIARFSCLLMEVFGNIDYFVCVVAVNNVALCYEHLEFFHLLENREQVNFLTI